MLKLVLLLRRKPGLSRAAFRDYYENHHVPLALKHSGAYIRSYRRNYRVMEFARKGEELEPVGGDGTLDCITEVCFEDQAALDAMFKALAEPRVKSEIAEDEARFLDRDSMRAFICEETGGEHGRQT
jgi:uncharacterized protein (TIGR02118 family)